MRVLTVRGHAKPKRLERYRVLTNKIQIQTPAACHVGRKAEGGRSRSKVDTQDRDVVAPDLRALPFANRMLERLHDCGGAAADAVRQNLLHSLVTVGPWVLWPADLVGHAVGHEQQTVASLIAQFTAAQ